MAVLEDQARDAEGRPGGQQAGEHADGGDHRRLEGDDQQDEAEQQHHPDHDRRVGGEHGGQVVVLGGGAADQDAGGQVGAQAVDGRRRWPCRTGRCAGTAWTIARPSPPALGRQ